MILFLAVLCLFIVPASHAAAQSVGGGDIFAGGDGGSAPQGGGDRFGGDSGDYGGFGGGVHRYRRPPAPVRIGGDPMVFIRRLDDQALVETCDTVLQQNRNFHNWPSCLSLRVVDFCKQFAGEHPECVAIVAELKEEVPNIGSLTRDGSRPVPRCRHNPQLAGCKNITVTRDPAPINDGGSDAPISLSALMDAVDQCFATSDPRYKRPDWNRFVLDSSFRRHGARENFDLSFQAIEFASEQPIGSFPLRRNVSMDKDLMRARLVGWIARCLGERNLLPILDSSQPYDEFLLRDERVRRDSARADELALEFGSGYRHHPQIYPLSDPGSLYTEPSPRHR